jgi:hypothetical protein
MKKSITEIETRLEALEASSSLATFKVVYADGNLPGIYWDGPIYRQDRGRKYSESDLEGLAETLFIVEYKKDWSEQHEKHNRD